MLAKNLKTLRKKGGYTYKDVSKGCQMTIRTFINYETSRSEPKSSVLINISDFFQVSIDDLLRKELVVKMEVKK